MSTIEYNGEGGRPLCFRHAVKAAIDKDEDVIATTSPPDDPNDWTGYLGQSCVECYPPDEEAE